MSSKSEPLLTLGEIAEMIGVKANTVSAYISRGQMPEPDKRYGRTPLWKLSTIKKWRNI